jgi:hypothetical protein
MARKPLERDEYLELQRLLNRLEMVTERGRQALALVRLQVYLSGEGKGELMKQAEGA